MTSQVCAALLRRMVGDMETLAECVARYDALYIIDLVIMVFGPIAAAIFFYKLGKQHAKR